MRKIDIHITKGAIKSFVVTMEDGLPEVAASVDLYADTGKKVSTFTISTQSWQGSEFELPPELVVPICDIARRLERTVIAACNREMKMLPAPADKPDA